MLGNDNVLTIYGLVLGKFGLNQTETEFPVSGLGNFCPNRTVWFPVSAFSNFLNSFKFGLNRKLFVLIIFFYSYCKLFRSVFNTYIYILH